MCMTVLEAGIVSGSQHLDGEKSTTILHGVNLCQVPDTVTSQCRNYDHIRVNVIADPFLSGPNDCRVLDI